MTANSDMSKKLEEMDSRIAERRAASEETLSPTSDKAPERNVGVRIIKMLRRIAERRAES